MAVTTSFKQECPTCSAMVSIKENMVGKKIECTKCKDKFIAERPEEDDDDDAPRGKRNAAGNGKKSTKHSDDDEVDDLEEVEEDEEEAPQVKGKPKPTANGKAKKSAVDDDEEDEEDDRKGKSKKEGGSNKLTISLALAVVGVLVLGVAAFFLLKGRRAPENTIVRTGGGPAKKDDNKEESKTPIVPVEVPNVGPSATQLNDAELARLSNLLPNDSEYVSHLFFKELFAPSGFLYEAAFKSPGALDAANVSRRLGFAVADVDDVIRAERYSQPSWRYTVIHFKAPLVEANLKSALNLKLAGAPIEGQTYYKMTEAHPVFDTLGQFSFGIPNWYRYFEPRRNDQPTYLYVQNAQTLIVGDEAPVMAFLKAKGQFPLLSARTAPPPPPPTTPTTPTPGTDGATPTPSNPNLPTPGGPRGKIIRPGKSGQAPEIRPNRMFAESRPFDLTNAPRLEATPVSFLTEEQDTQLLPTSTFAKLPNTTWKGPERDKGGQTMYLTFQDKDGVIISSDVAGVMAVVGAWQVKANNPAVVVMASPKIPGYAWEFEIESPGKLKGVGRNAQGTWTFVLTQTSGDTIGQLPTPKEGAPDPAPKDPKDPSVPGPSGPALVMRDDMYLTIRPALKAILDRMEARVADSQDKVLMSCSADMEASRIDTGLPEFRDRVVRRPRQFWDITVMLREPSPRIRMLGTTLVQRGDLQRYQLRNELSCSVDAEAAEIKKEIVEQASFSIAQFLKKLVNHDVRLPALPAKKAPDGAIEEKKATQVNFSQMTVNQQASKVEFVLDLVLDNAALNHLQGIAALTAGSLRVEMESLAMKSLRHALAKADKSIADKGISDRDVPAGRFPPGAFLRAKTPFHIDQEPRNRISWMASLLPYMGQQHLYNRLQFDQSWREPGNWMAGNAIVPQFLAPNYPEYLRRVAVGELALDFGATHYVGVAGVGLDAAAYSRNDPATAHKRGVFGYDGSASLDEIQKGRGLGNTIAMIQLPYDGVTGVSPWIAGGGATLRGVPEKNSIAPFVLSKDKYDRPIENKGKRGAFVMMADGSVRFIDQSVSDDVFKAMCTVQGPAPSDFNPSTNPLTPLVPEPEKGADEPPPPPIVPSTPEKKTPLTAFIVPGKFSIETPAGFAWRFSQDVVMDGRTNKLYECLKPGAEARLVLEMEEKKLDTDEQKRSLITKDLEKNLGAMKLAGIAVTEEIKPNLQSPISSRIEFRYSLKKPDGTSLIVHGKVIFGRAVYAITVAAAKKEDAQALMRTVDTFQELPAGPSDPATKKPTAGARHQGEGRVVDQNRRFSIAPPKGWQANNDAKLPVPVKPFLFYMGPKAEFTPNLIIIDTPNDGSTIEAVGAQLKVFLGSAKRTILDDGFETIDGKKVYRVAHSGSSPVNGKDVESTAFQFYVFGSNNRAFVVTFSSSPGAFAGLRKTMEECARSMRID